MRRFFVLLGVLAVVTAAGAAEHWTGFARNNLWSDVGNWDDMLPWVPTGSGTSWDANRPGELGTPANHVINVDATGFVGTGTIYTQPGYTTTMTILKGIVLDTYNLTLSNAADAASRITLTVQSGAELHVDELDATLVIGSRNHVVVQAGGYFLSDYFQLHDGYAILDIYGVADTWGISKFSDDPGHEINVHTAGRLKIGPYGINWDKNPNRRIGVYNLGTVQLAGNRTTNYLDVVTNLVPGTWLVDYNVTLAGYTTIKLVAPCWDQDGDHDVDMIDFAAFQRCITTGSSGPVSSGCECYDTRSTGAIAHSDGQVDSWDLAAFQECASGPAAAAPPGCAD